MEIPVEIASLCRKHPTEDVLEEYAFGRIEETRIGPIEEHLLVCTACQTALQNIDDYIRLVKAAAAPRAPRPRLFVLPRWEWAAAFALALALIVAVPGPVAHPITVSLESYRGPENLSPAPARHPLDLSIDAVSLPIAADYRLEVVTESGRPVWTGHGTPAAGKFSQHIDHGFAAGKYWVRVYGNDGELLSEYGLKVD